ncbi:MAG: HIRAN domain-containing protein [Chloroflexota bacterium]
MFSTAEFHQIIKEGSAGKLLGKYSKSHHHLKRVYLFETRVAGFQHHQGKDPKVRVLLFPGAELILVREPENKYDSKAVAIYTQNGDKIGFVPRSENHIPAAMADQDLYLGAEVTRFDLSLVDNAPWECLDIRIFQSMPKARKNPFISLVCPQCGGPMDFEAGVPKIKCPYCGVVHILLGLK